MKPLYLLPLLLLSCKKEPVQNTVPQDTLPLKQEAPKPEPKPATVSLWDFNGDGTDDNNLTINLTESTAEGEDNPNQGNWTIIFNNKRVSDLHITGGEPTPVGEGDLNANGAAELTIIQAPNHGCTYTLTVWSFGSGKWQQVFGPELLPTACDHLNPDDLNNLIVKENGTVYFYKTDVNDEEFKKMKMEVKLQ